MAYYPVLAPLSRSYPQLKGRLPTRYSPVRHCTFPVAQDFSFDLHVLGTPPAFVLSQDQTLQLIFWIKNISDDPEAVTSILFSKNKTQILPFTIYNQTFFLKIE